jgi:Mrp family chromosome partitioning ATPase
MADESTVTEEQQTATEPTPESCDNSCSSCSSTGCGSRSSEPVDFSAKQHEQSDIKHVIAVVSGKGGVGKTLVTSLLASSLFKQGYKVGVLDADITGPSIPRAFGVDDKLRATAVGLLPSVTKEGMQVVSTNLVLPDETTPVLWRGTIISGLVKQFFSEVIWGDIDYLIVDMPPGTGDVPLTVYQSLPIDGIVIVTAPQDLVSMIVGKAINMAEMMDVPVLGIVENMSYFECDECGKTHHIFGDGRIEELASKHNIDLVAQIPIDPSFAQQMDKGEVEAIDIPSLAQFANALIAKVND